MKVVILCGGQGTRLREETEYRPKPLVAIGGKPILWHIMKTYSAYGFHDFVLCLGYKGEMIKDYFINYDLLNSDFTIQLGTKQIVTVPLIGWVAKDSPSSHPFLCGFPATRFPAQDSFDQWDPNCGNGRLNEANLTGADPSDTSVPADSIRRSNRRGQPHSHQACDTGTSTALSRQAGGIHPVHPASA